MLVGDTVLHTARFQILFQPSILNVLQIMDLLTILKYIDFAKKYEAF